MRIYLVTDLEGVCGVMNFRDWCTPESRYYEEAKRLLTAEVNAAVEGFLAGGAAEVTAVARIRSGAQRAAQRAQKEDSGMVKLAPPYERVVALRAHDVNPPRFSITRHASSVMGLLNQPLDLKPMSRFDPLDFI